MESLCDPDILLKIGDELAAEFEQNPQQQPRTNADLEDMVMKRYSQKIYAVQQFPSIHLDYRSTINPGLATKYRYSPLSTPTEIRLLRFDRFITFGREYYSCEIFHADLNDDPPYILRVGLNG
jgi:hypothetical protein